MRVSDLVVGLKTAIERDERAATLLLAAFTALLAVAFMVLLISDQVQAAT